MAIYLTFQVDFFTARRKPTSEIAQFKEFFVAPLPSSILHGIQLVSAGIYTIETSQKCLT